MIGELAALGAAVSWTVSALLYRKALTDAKPVSSNIVRLTLTSLILLLFLAATGKIQVLTSLPADAAILAGISGVIGLGLGDTFYLTSLKRIGVARAVPITCTYPLFNILLAIFLEGEQVTFSVVAGASVIVLGVWLLSQEEKKAGIERRVLIRSMILALAAALLWSISISMINMAAKLAPGIDQALAINTLRVTAIGAVLLASSFVIDRDLGFLKMQRKTVITLVAGGIVALGLGWFFLTFSFTDALESRAVPISSTTPLFSTIAGIVLLHEKVTLKNILGSVLVVGGICLIFLLK
jgi:DME family drug/metabolite transporter